MIDFLHKNNKLEWFNGDFHGGLVLRKHNVVQTDENDVRVVNVLYLTEDDIPILKTAIQETFGEEIWP